MRTLTPNHPANLVSVTKWIRASQASPTAIDS